MKQAKTKKEASDRFGRRMFRKIRANKVSFAVYVFLCVITCAVIVLTASNRNWSGTFTGFLALILFLLPAFVEESFRIELPTTLEIIVMLFVFCAEILGEIGMYYTKYPFWDNMLHCTNGFIFAAFGFSLVDIFNRNRRVDFHLSPFFLSLVALCFSMTVGVVWEFFEFGWDCLTHSDMQKDFMLGTIVTGKLSPDGQTPVTVSGIVQTVVTLADGSTYVIDGGYLDIGLFDTMKDLIVDFIGALAFSVIGFFYVRQRGKGRIAQQFIPQVPLREESSAAEEKTVPQGEPQ